MDLLDFGFVKRLETWGSDTAIARAARTSTGKEGDDAKLLRYLYKNKHTSPFEMAGVKVHVKCPVFVARQWMRHRTWSYNELSQRYQSPSMQFYLPRTFRTQGVGNKQVSGDPVSPETMIRACAETHDAYNFAATAYQFLLDEGVSREQARIVLPVGVFTEFVAQANLHNVLHFLRLRLAPDAQPEIREYAEELGKIVAGKFPLTWECFVDENTDERLPPY